MESLIDATTSPATHGGSGAQAPQAPSSRQLFARFRPIFQRIAERAAQRENDRELAYEPVAWLNAEHFGALRVPLEHGGIGASVEQLYDLLIELGEADSNLPQILRAHFGFIERLLAEIDPALHGPWMRLAAEGVIFGNATTELGDGSLSTMQTTLKPDGDAWLLDGDKYYSTGTLYADWISVSAQRMNADGSSERVIALVPAQAEGVERIDDWRGFGQRLSASGTTRFRNVRVKPGNVLRPAHAAHRAFPADAPGDAGRHRTGHRARRSGLRAAAQARLQPRQRRHAARRSAGAAGDRAIGEHGLHRGVHGAGGGARPR